MSARFYRHSLFVFSALFFCASTHAQDVKNLPGSIPLEFGRRPAKGLLFDGKPISPDEITRKVLTQEFDPSFLDPAPEVPVTQFDVNSIGEPYEPALDDISVYDGDEVNFLEKVDSTTDHYRFQFSKKDEFGNRQDYIAYFGTYAHNALLRKNLLRKLGYKVPAMKHLKNLKVKMPGISSRNFLIDEIDLLMDGHKSPMNWITNLHSFEEYLATLNQDGEEARVTSDLRNGQLVYSYEFNGEIVEVDRSDIELVSKYYFLPEDVVNYDDSADGQQVEDNSTDVLNFQDVIVLKAQEAEIINFAYGVINTETINGRREFNTLLLPFAMTDIRESLNIFPWNCGQERNRQFFVNYSEINFEDNPFSITHADARWMARRLAKLTDHDFEEIAAHAGYPYEVSLVVAEKLKSWRNCFADGFKVNKKFYFKGEKYKSKKLNKSLRYKDLKVRSKLTAGDRLKKGKLLVDDWDGYSANFAFGDPDNPVSRSEIIAFLRSQVTSNLILDAVRRFNDSLLSGPDAQQRFAANLEDKALQAFIKSLGSGKEEKVGFGVFTNPIYSGRVIASRDVVAGAYLGTDNNNRVQIVDRVGISGRAGLFLGFEGLPKDYFGVGEVSVTYSRIYDHIRPLTTIKQANNEEFKNIMVPWTKKRLSKIIDNGLAGINLDEPGFGNFDAFAGAMDEFKKNMLVGESIVISDTINGLAALFPSLSLAESLTLQAQMDAQKRLVLSRLHIHRKSKNEFHIYKDRGNLFSLGIGLGLNAYRVPIISLSYRFTKGQARTEFYTLNLKEPDSTIEGGIENLEQAQLEYIRSSKALMEVIEDGSIGAVKDMMAPYSVDLKFSQSESDFWFLFNQELKLKAKNDLIVTDRKGSQKNFVTRSSGVRKGKNFQKLAVDVLNSLVDELLDGSDIRVASQTNGIPGDTFYGSSLHRDARFEAEIREDSPSFAVDRFANVNYRWKGWNIGKDGLYEIFDSLEQKFGQGFFPRPAFNDTEQVFLYTLDLNVNIYEYGIERLARLSEEEFFNLFNRYFQRNNMEFSRYRRGSCVMKGPNRRRPNTVCYEVYESIMKEFMRHQEDYLESLADKNATGVAKYGMRMTSLIESILSVEGLLEAVGERNVYIKGSLAGFRVGDEAAERRATINSNTIGRIGSVKIDGPIRELQSKDVGMSESEFNAYWIRRRL